MARIPAWVGPLSLTCAVCCSSPAMHARSDHVAAPPPPPPAATVATIAGGEPGPTSGPDAPSVVADEPDPPSQQLQLARDIWQRLDQTHNTCPDSYDYHPEGGLRMFACHLRALVPYRTLHEASGLSVFLSGPHTDTELSLTSDKSFGYYNPELVRWMVEHLVPGAHDSAFRAATQGHYDTYVRPLTRIFYGTHQKLEQHPDCFERERKKYLAALKRGVPRDYLEKYFYFMNPKFCSNPEGGYKAFSRDGFDAGWDGNVTKTCVGFWIRRSVDHTDQEFFRGLQKLVHSYDPGLEREMQSARF